MKIGDLVYSGHLLEIGHMVLGIITDSRAGTGEAMFFISWVDGSEPSWYYGNEVERVSENR